MFRSFCLLALGLSLLTAAEAQTGPATSPTPRKAAPAKAHAPTPPRTVSNETPAARRANPLRGTNDNGVGQSGYSAPGEPIASPSAGGKNTATYDGRPAKPAKNNTTLATPK